MVTLTNEMSFAETRKNLTQTVYEDMLSNIAKKVWLPGDRLPTEKELMQMYSVSRITIREAVRQLNSLCLLRTVQGSGTYVCEYSPDIFIVPMTKTALLSPTRKEDILNIMEVRYLEVIVAGQAAECSAEEGVAKLEAIHQRLLSEPNSYEVHSAVDVEFHMQICAMINNPFLTQVCQIIYDALAEAMPVIGKIMGPEGAFYYHAKLIDTIKKHYVMEARATMEEHLRVTMQAVMNCPDDSDLFLGSKNKD